MNFGSVLCLFFTAIWWVVLGSKNHTLVTMFQVNAALQVALFIAVACIPYLKTKRMSYVDIAWPFGVALIGVLLIAMGEGNLLRRLLVGGVYLMIGLRMGVGAVTMGLRTGVIFKTEFPRYQYRKMILEQSGTRHIKFHSLTEMLAQGFANASVLALPGFMMAVNPDAVISPWEVAGIGIWLIAYVLESVADTQKLMFISKNKEGVCNIGLWRFSRHPNYFSEWLVWTGLVVATVPSWWALQASESFLVWVVMGVGAVAASGMLYTTLIYLTGAIPAEYYSMRKRPEYAEYQQKTNMFFPWFPRS